MYPLQWLAFHNDGQYSAADYAKAKSEVISKERALGEQRFWNPYEWEEKFKRRRIFVIRLLRGAINGLAYMHNRERLHQSLGPASVVLKYDGNADISLVCSRDFLFFIF